MSVLFTRRGPTPTYSGGGSGGSIGSGLASDLEVGSSVFLNVNGTLKEFLIVHQGNPDTTWYDTSCEGTWLLMKDVYEKRTWDSSDNDYENSDIHNYLNSTFLGLFDSDVQSAIKQVILPFHCGTGSGGSYLKGASGLSTKIFLLSGYELGWDTNVDNCFPVDGSWLNYFYDISDIDSKRIGYYNGMAANWWLRSPYTGNASNVWYVLPGGGYANTGYSSSCGVRPALILPSNALFDENGEFVGVQESTDPEVETCELKITGTPDRNYAYITIDGTKHYASGSISIPVGTTISVYVGGLYSLFNCKITHNGSTVKSGSGTYEIQAATNRIDVYFEQVETCYTADITSY